jgi:ribosome biogenesis protein ENP2
MKTSAGTVPVYTLSGSEARPLPEWLVRKRKRSLKNDPEFQNRVELLQDFSFEEASQCVRVSEDGDWLMSTGTYKPSIHVHNLNQLALSFARNTDDQNQKFHLLSTDASKSVHLQQNRTIEFHTGGGCHYTSRIPRYGRDLIYDRRSAECVIPSVGTSADGMGEAFRLNLEVGRFMRSYEVDVGGAAGSGLQGGIDAGAVECGAIAHQSHGLLAFGTTIGTVEVFDSRSRTRVGILQPLADDFEGRGAITALQFPRSGLEMAVGNSNGIVQLYDLRSPKPLLSKDLGYGFAVQDIIYLESSSRNAGMDDMPKILTADKKSVKIWDARDGKNWTTIEPNVDLRQIEWVPDTGMLLSANEGGPQHSWFIPQLGPAPRWCSFLDNIVEEMAEDPNDPNAFGAKSGEVYDNFKFLTLEQLKTLSLDHLVGTTGLLRPYMHGFFVAQKLYEEARLISNPDLWQEQRAKSIAEKINKERESRIRGTKKATVKVNRKLAEKMLEKQEEQERRQAKRLLKKGGDDDMLEPATAPAVEDPAKPEAGVLSDPRFAKMFEDPEFEIDEQTHEFQMLNPSTKIPKGLTAAEQEDMESRKGSSSDSSDSETERVRQHTKKTQDKEDKTRISSSAYKKAGHRSQKMGPEMVVSSSNQKERKAGPTKDRTFGSRVSKLKERRPKENSGTTTVVGEREITFAPERKQKKRSEGDGQRHDRRKDGDRRNASNNVFRNM